MSNARDIGGNLNAVGESHAGNFTQCGIGLFGRCGINADADTPFLRRLSESRGLGFFLDLLPPVGTQLIDCWHVSTSLIKDYEITFKVKLFFLANKFLIVNY
jgi:hypothetical protein